MILNHASTQYKRDFVLWYATVCGRMWGFGRAKKSDRDHGEKNGIHIAILSPTQKKTKNERNNQPKKKKIKRRKN